MKYSKKQLKKETRKEMHEHDIPFFLAQKIAKDHLSRKNKRQ